MGAGRADKVGVALLAAFAALAFGGDALALALSRALPSLGFPLLALLIKASSALLLLAAAYRLRRLLAAAGAFALGQLDAAEARLDALPKAQGLALRVGLVSAVVGALVLALFELTPFGAALETPALDLLFRLRFPERSQAELATGQAVGSANRQPDVAVIAIDDETIARLGWPLPRWAYARLIDAVSAAGPASLTFDVSLVDPSREHPEWDEAIGEAAKRAGNVAFSFTVARATAASRAPSPVALRALEASSIPWHESASSLPDYAELIGGDAQPQPVLDPVAGGAHAIAMANVLLDGQDDVLRHSLVAARLRTTLLPSLSLRVAAQALGVPLSEVKLYPGSHLELGQQRKVPLDRLGRTLVRYQGRHDTRGEGPFQYLSMWSLLRADAVVTLEGNPLGDDQRFVLDEQTKVTVNGQPVRLEALDASLLAKGVAASGKARYSSDPGHLDELALGGVAPAEPELELVDEQVLSFNTRLGSAQRRQGDVSALAKKHLFVGSTALAAADLRNSPLGAIPGVEHHATMLANLLHDDFFTPSPRWANGVMVALGAVLAAVVAVSLPTGLGLAMTALLMLGWLTAAYASFRGGVFVPVVAPGGAMGLSALTCLVMGARAARNARLKAEKEREFVRHTFGRYLTEQVVQQLLDSPDGLRLGGQRDNVTIMMTDLRGFTSMCGTMEPEHVVTLLNHYLEAMTRIITRYGGTIDEFIGDAILVVFGAPVQLDRPEARAVACAIEMLNAMPAVNEWNLAQGLPRVEMGIGIHSGEVVLGNIGSELRAKYGIVGATINLTSRVESYTVGGQVLISEATRTKAGELVVVGASQVVSPKGVKGTMTIFEALAVGPPFDVKLQSAAEELTPPRAPLELKYALIKSKQVSESWHRARVEALSEQGLELAIDEELEVLSDLQLKVVEGDGVRPGELYGKVIKANVRPRVVYLRLTSVPAELRGVLDAARAGKAAAPVADSALVSS